MRDATSYSVAQINSPCHHLLATRPRGLNHAVAVESSLPLGGLAENPDQPIAMLSILFRGCILDAVHVDCSPPRFIT